MRIKQGRSRLVFIFKRFVIKIPNPFEWECFLHGFLHNMEENRISNVNKQFYDDSAVCPVLWCSGGGWVQIMARAREVTPYEFKRYIFKKKWDIKNLHSDLQEYAEFKPQNYGWLGNRIVLIDYGSPILMGEITRTRLEIELQKKYDAQNE